MLPDEVGREDIFHVAGIELGVVDVVDLAVDACVFDGLEYIFDTDDLACPMGHKVGNGARAGIEIIDERGVLRICCGAWC